MSNAYKLSQLTTLLQLNGVMGNMDLGRVKGGYIATMDTEKHTILAVACRNAGVEDVGYSRIPTCGLSDRLQRYLRQNGRLPYPSTLLGDTVVDVNMADVCFLVVFIACSAAGPMYAWIVAMPFYVGR